MHKKFLRTYHKLALISLVVVSCAEVKECAASSPTLDDGQETHPRPFKHHVAQKMERGDGTTIVRCVNVPCKHERPVPIGLTFTDMEANIQAVMRAMEEDQTANGMCSGQKK